MEPRPPSSRPAPGQPAARPPAGPEPGGYPQQPDPATVVAPPRTDYDYSPLDLAPPGQRRRRQLVAAALGGLVVLLLLTAAIFAFVVLREDDGDDADLAAIATQAAADAATREASTPEAPAAGEETDTTEENAAPTATAALDAAGEQAAIDPTVAEQVAPATTGGPDQATLQTYLPSVEQVPLGLDSVTDTARTQEEVVAALGGSREAETNLTTWGWTANVERAFAAPDPAALAPDATTNLTVSLHSFGSDQAAAEALTFYADILVNSGYQEVEIGDVGQTNRMLVQPQEDGGTTVALYVQQGPVLYRIGGYSPAGDPTQSVVNVAQTIIANQGGQ